MCWGQSPGTRTIATSRSEATTTESEPDDETKARAQGPPRPTNPKAMRRPPGATSTESRGGEPFPLDRLFQERPHRPETAPQLVPLTKSVSAWCLLAHREAFARRAPPERRGCVARATRSTDVPRGPDVRSPAPRSSRPVVVIYHPPAGGVYCPARAPRRARRVGPALGRPRSSGEPQGALRGMVVGAALRAWPQQHRDQPRPVPRGERQQRYGEGLDGAGIRGFRRAGATTGATARCRGHKSFPCLTCV